MFSSQLAPFYLPASSTRPLFFPAAFLFLLSDDDKYNR
jgi:hypothetical protein